MKMTEDEYAGTQQRVMMIARVVSMMDLQGFLDEISRAHSIGPILDPTTYRAAMDNLTKIEAVARAMYAFQVKAKEILKEDLEEAAKGKDGESH